MAKTAVKEITCDICGADVRDGSVYCYNCGSSVAAVVSNDPVAAEETKAGSNSKSPAGDIIPSVVRSQRANKVLPRKRAIQNRDVTWEERDGMSAGFIVTTLVLVLISAAILFAGFYLR